MRTILGITGIRSEYDIMSSVFHAINDHADLNFQVFVTGAHLSSAYGLTVEEIQKDGFLIADQVDSLINGDTDSCRVKGLAIQLQGLIQTVVRLRPDILLVLGDREESMTTALVGAYMNIPVAHVAGGDRVVGNVDDQIRHAVSKLSHVHFTTNEESKQRLLKLGEQDFRVINVGNPGLDRLVHTRQLSVKELSQRLDVKLSSGEPYLILIQHIISSEIDQAYEQMVITLEAIKELGITTILSYPNSDAGGQEMIRAIEEYRFQIPHLHIFKNIPRLEFVNILRNASCLVGNSSAGILEAPILKLPVVNIGNRQSERLHSENVTFIPHQKDQIISAITNSLYDPEVKKRVDNCINPYGDGNSSARIASILAELIIDENLLNKDITY